ncbi:hypothetical protein L6164_028873 [Bauhinia variegata]|uniref:Uncharacterized protein n=1 Tax=Bauhinia variegata TaxID=167791 RepID=A0ACB9L867_BAUVA|nr:hypothetical protein L6164_028873 [Bauhinia variegata]
MEFMAFSTVLFLLLTLSLFPCSSSSSTKGFSLSVEETDHVIVSPNGMFSAGFHKVGENAFCFAIWFSEPHGQNTTVVWMANPDYPVNGKRSTLSLQGSGNLVLTDANQFNVWATNTSSPTSVKLVLNNDGNLVLHEVHGGAILWQSFNYPTNTLLPGQTLTRDTALVSSRSESNLSSGFYKLFFDKDNVLHLLYDGFTISSFYWPDPWKLVWADRFTYNASRLAVLDVLGNFSSTDNYHFMTSDYGAVLQRRLSIDYDGNIRVYSRKHMGEKWYVSWQAKQQPCKIHGTCGPNSICSNDPYSGRKCSCLPGYKVKNESDLSYGCEAEFRLSCNKNESHFRYFNHVEFFGYDFHYTQNSSYKQCEDLCSQLCDCVGFQYSFKKETGYADCFPKTMLLNGYRSPAFEGAIYLKLPKGSSFSHHLEEYVRNCSHTVNPIFLERGYVKGHEKMLVKVFLWFVCVIAVIEVVGISIIWSYLTISKKKSSIDQGYGLTTSGFRKFSYSELKKATNGFSQEIGRGGGGIVYKAILSDHRVAAVKRLNEANQGESEFLAEVSIIGRLNHMNLIEMWGYCTEGKHRLLVYKYMENGSLAENLLSETLDWKKRYDIALGTAKGLAYLHEECLEWILHCDIKPQNILLDFNFEPKIADFGLSKLQNRNNINNANFSTIRGTRGYMAPEWIFNLPITSKVDVYSYGIVVLEMITGKSPSMNIDIAEGAETHHGRLVTWVRERKSKGSTMASWVEEIIDPTIEGNYDLNKMEILSRVALDCVEEEKDVRPNMSQIVEMLQNPEKYCQH